MVAHWSDRPCPALFASSPALIKSREKTWLLRVVSPPASKQSSRNRRCDVYGAGMSTPRKRTRRVADAYQEAEALGPLTYVEPAARLVDGAPALGPDQVYVTPTGQVFHTGWCDLVGHQWDQRPKNLRVTVRSGVGRRRLCQQCEAAGGV